jgi:hypothetical protein
MSNKGSKFLQSSSAFSETQVLKSKYLIPILESYNNLILKSNKIEIKESQKYMIPNNNNKFYLFITNKYDTTNNKNDNKYKILYFFPSSEQKNNLFKHLITDFYVEIDSHKTNFTKSNYLFEGFLYNKDDFNTFLISDILCIDNKIIESEYFIRYNIINNTIKNLDNLNGHLNIGVHSMFEYDTDNFNMILRMFKNNFKFKTDINSVQIINNNNLVKTNTTETICIDKLKKRITKGKFIDVYNVFNINTNNNEGILYIRTINDSKILRKMFEDKENKGVFFIEVTCEYNNHFKKWYVKLN